MKPREKREFKQRNKTMNRALASRGTASSGLIYIELESLKKRLEWETEQIFEEIMAKIFLNFVIIINLQIQGIQ